MDALLERARRIDLTGGEIQLYQSSFSLPTGSASPFLVSADPFWISPQMKAELEEFGPILAKYYHTLQHSRGDEPDFFFLRPDILLTDEGWHVCEVETSLFGLSLTFFLAAQYGQEYLLLGSAAQIIGAFVRKWRERWGTARGVLVYSEHTQRFAGQLQYLANVLTSYGLEFYACRVEDPRSLESPAYRCYYSFEAQLDPAVGKFQQKNRNISPQAGDFYEGKEPLTLLQQDNNPEWSDLRQHILPTWRLTEIVPDDFPTPVKEWDQLADLPKSQRKFVLKRVGAHPEASWARSVFFLDDMSKEGVRQLLRRCAREKSAWWVIQSLVVGKKFHQEFADFSAKKMVSMDGRVRLTPYYDFRTGKLLSAKATIRPRTLYLHGATDAINTAVAVRA